MKEIGAKIQQARLARGIQFEEIVHHTHIHLSHLQKIENGQFDFLPRPYVTAFVKTFAQHVGLDGEALIRQWREKEAADEALRLQQQQTQETRRPENDTRPLTSVVTKLNPKTLATSPATSAAPSMPLAIPYLKEIGLGLGIILVLTTLVIIMSGAGEEKSVTTAPAEPEVRTEKIDDPKQVTENPFTEVSQQAQKITESKPEPVTPPSQNLTLQAQFENQTRLRVVTDGRDTTLTIYKAGATQTYSAKERFNLRISTGGNVTLMLAGKSLGKFGQPGKVVVLTITSAGVTEQRTFTPQQPPARSALPLDTLSIRRPRGFN